MHTVANHWRSVTILGVRIDDVTRQDFLDIVARWVTERTPRQIVTVNPEFVMQAQKRLKFAGVLRSADLALPDGVGILWAAKRQGLKIVERVGGSDVLLPLSRQCAELGQSVFLLGAGPGVAKLAAHRLTVQAPGLTIAGTYAGSPAVEDEPDIIQRITSVRPDILLVAYGAPAQEEWIARNLTVLHVPIVMGVGGAIDYAAGIRRRAPVLIQRLWLDWLFRLITQPWRWRRMLALPRYVWAVVSE